MITMTFFMSLFLNNNGNDIKTLGNIYNRISNGNLWSLITPSLMQTTEPGVTFLKLNMKIPFWLVTLFLVTKLNNFLHFKSVFKLGRDLNDCISNRYCIVSFNVNYVSFFQVKCRSNCEDQVTINPLYKATSFYLINFQIFTWNDTTYEMPHAQISIGNSREYFFCLDESILVTWTYVVY